MWNTPEIEEYLKKAVHMKKDFPDLVLGFDMV
jgi:hypothetical protein